MPRSLEIFLDIETTWDGEITLVGFYSSDTGLVQLLQGDLNKRRLHKELPRNGHLYTYNGHSFDCFHVHKQFGINLRERYDSRDLRWICQRNGITGGQKIIEKRFGFKRKTEGMEGWDAVCLWNDYLHGDEEALKTLLLYNKEDIKGMIHIKRKLFKKIILK